MASIHLTPEQHKKLVALGPRIYTCAEWGATAPSHGFARTEPSVIVLHHTAGPNRASIADHDEAVHQAFFLARDIQRFHMDGNGWADTGQHGTISIDGICLEGRHGSVAAVLSGQCVRGAHAADPDTGADANDSWGTEHEGTFTSEPMSRVQWNASVWMHAWIAALQGIDTAKVQGHRDTGVSTACPGDWFHAALPRFRTDVHNKKLSLLKACGAV